MMCELRRLTNILVLLVGNNKISHNEIEDVTAVTMN